jgi:hypothetical protein
MARMGSQDGREGSQSRHRAVICQRTRRRATRAGSEGEDGDEDADEDEGAGGSEGACAGRNEHDPDGARPAQPRRIESAAAYESEHDPDGSCSRSN